MNSDVANCSVDPLALNVDGSAGAVGDVEGGLVGSKADDCGTSRNCHPVSTDLPRWLHC